MQCFRLHEQSVGHGFLRLIQAKLEFSSGVIFRTAYTTAVIIHVLHDLFLLVSDLRSFIYSPTAFLWVRLKENENFARTEQAEFWTCCNPESPNQQTPNPHKADFINDIPQTKVDKPTSRQFCRPLRKWW